MSKTDKTDPWWVKVKKNPEHSREVHHHEDGICNIAEDSDDWRECRVDALWWHPIYRCCCVMCDGSAYGWGDKQQNRKDRRKAKAYCRNDWKKEW